MPWLQMSGCRRRFRLRSERRTGIDEGALPAKGPHLPILLRFASQDGSPPLPLRRLSYAHIFFAKAGQEGKGPKKGLFFTRDFAALSKIPQYLLRQAIDLESFSGAKKICESESASQARTVSITFNFRT